MKNSQPLFSHPNKTRGIALLMVLVGIAIITVIVLEFAYQTDVTYNVAYNDYDKVRAQALAESGLQFSKMVIKLDQDAKSMAGKSKSSMAKSVANIAVYKLIPIDTEQLRLQAQAPVPIAVPAEDGGAPVPVEPLLAGASAPEDFFNFMGDFAVDINEEDTKLNINLFNLKMPTEKIYSQQKSILYHLLASDEFKGVFEDRYRGAQELAQNIADYIDQDDLANQSDGYDRGREGQQGGSQVKMKNARLLSIEELILVPGMQENIFQKLKKYLTVYGTSEKILLCRSEEALQKAFIIAYSEDNPNIAPLADDNEDLLKKGIEAFQNNCPEPPDVVKALDLALGVSSGSETAPAPAAPSSGSGATAGSPGSAGGTPAVAFPLLQWMKKDAKIFSVESRGKAGESIVKIKTVFDASVGSPSQWKELYWRVE